ncbi:hypothetical protein TRFO_11897 [Tritrichomonas foetus]|uniref:Uncharacterized protein n=1 Tax=Tritrichomonas foetus TaxID=1144522 RepID=A0A1J4J1H9_9EUKA|nr:hypothetical protein TRFO_11897 [Tritrichomonas foetus]|eukprot:OHS93282.1 hypothetical protein TRFO_11897 [Tritrichomonas foetus]
MNDDISSDDEILQIQISSLFSDSEFDSLTKLSDLILIFTNHFLQEDQEFNVSQYKNIFPHLNEAINLCEESDNLDEIIIHEILDFFYQKDENKYFDEVDLSIVFNKVTQNCQPFKFMLYCDKIIQSEKHIIPFIKLLIRIHVDTERINEIFSSSEFSKYVPLVYLMYQSLQIDTYEKLKHNKFEIIETTQVINLLSYLLLQKRYTNEIELILTSIPIKRIFCDFILNKERSIRVSSCQLIKSFSFTIFENTQIIDNNESNEITGFIEITEIPKEIEFYEKGTESSEMDSAHNDDSLNASDPGISLDSSSLNEKEPKNSNFLEFSLSDEFSENEIPNEKHIFSQNEIFKRDGNDNDNKNDESSSSEKEINTEYVKHLFHSHDAKFLIQDCFFIIMKNIENIINSDSDFYEIDSSYFVEFLHLFHLFYHAIDFSPLQIEILFEFHEFLVKRNFPFHKNLLELDKILFEKVEINIEKFILIFNQFFGKKQTINNEKLEEAVEVFLPFFQTFLDQDFQAMIPLLTSKEFYRLCFRVVRIKNYENSDCFNNLICIVNEIIEKDDTVSFFLSSLL